VFEWRWSGGEALPRHGWSMGSGRSVGNRWSQMGWPALDKEEAERQSETTIELCVIMIGHVVTPP
jgi:hypothetical protein